MRRGGAILIACLLGQELPLKSAEVGAIHVFGVVARGYLICTHYALLVLVGVLLVLVEAWIAYWGVVEVLAELLVVPRALGVRAALSSPQRIHGPALPTPAPRFHERAPVAIGELQQAISRRFLPWLLLELSIQ